MSEPLLIGIGGVVIKILTNDNIERSCLLDFYKNFIVETGDSDISLEYHLGDHPNISTWEELFNSGGVWRLWRRADQYAVCYQIPVLESLNPNLAILDSNFSHGVIFIPKGMDFKYILPVNYKFLEFLIVCYLSNNHAGIMLHACAIKDGEKGRLFSGVSGAGKSTISRLWAKDKNVTVLSDDRIILRKRDDRFFMYGTPWHGDASFISPEKVPVEQIFILQHADRNQEKVLKPLESTALLLTRSFTTFWSAKGMEFTIDFLAELNRAVPCYELGFRPEPDVVDFVRCLN